MNEEGFGQVFYLTVVLIALFVPLIILLYIWNKKRKAGNSIAEMKKELSEFENLKKKGILTPEEHKQVAQHLSQQIMSKTLQGSKSREKDLSAEDMLMLLQNQVKQDLSVTERNRKTDGECGNSRG